MRFYKLTNSISDGVDDNVKLKVECFWHYWDFLFTENRDLILVNEPKFTSQLSLINKIEKHLEWNNKINLKILTKYFHQNIYFDNNNIIIRTNSQLSEKIRLLKRKIEKLNGKLNLNERKDLLKHFGYLKEDFFNSSNLSNVLIEDLVKIIFNHKDLNIQVKTDLKFLCNSIIDILVLRGYSLKFISGLLSNTILHSSNKFNFQYKKKFIDFNSRDDWKKYVSGQYKLLTLHDRLTYLKHFLTKSKNKGFFIFKVEGVKFESEPIEIFGLKFYNPQNNKMLNYYDTENSKQRQKNHNFYSRCELFHTNHEIYNNLKAKDSTCNLIVPTEYFNEDLDHFDLFNYPTKSFIEAYNKAIISFLEFKRYLKSFSVEYFFDESFSNTKISKESILVDENYNYHKSSNDIIKNEIVFKVDEIRKVMINEQLNFKEKIKFQSSFSNHLANSNALIAEYKLENYKFNFKSLWIECIEPYFNDTNEFINFAKKSIRIRTNFFSNYRILLSNALRSGFFYDGAYSLDESKLKKIGIEDLNVGEKIIGDNLENNFELLPSGSLLDEFKEEMRIYVNDDNRFIKKIDNWISKTVIKAYDERNIEVHYNIVDYYNDISIKKDILFISSCVIGTFNDAIFISNIQNVGEAKDYINIALKNL